MKKLLILSLICFSAMLGQAQVRRHTTNIAAGFQVVQPTGQFADRYDGIPTGFAGSLMIPVRHSMFELGGSYAWNVLASKNEDILVETGTSPTGQIIYSGGTLRVRSNDNRYNFVTRIRPFAGKFQPYAEVFIGLENFSTQSDIQTNNSSYSQATTSNISDRDFVFNTGWAGGLRVRLAPHVFFDGRFESTNGAVATFIDKESIQVVNQTQLQYDKIKSKTNRNVYQIGLAVTF